jgi:23S rRNA pseudouridine1911/1915/1917 synthase
VLLLSNAEVYGSLSVDPVPDDEADLLIDDGEVDPRRRFSVDPALAGERLDKALVRWMPDISRSRLKQWVEVGAVRVNGAVVRPRHELGTGDLVELEPQPAPDAKAYQPEPMSLAVLFEDADMLVIDKPPGLVVHPAAGHWSGTLLNGLLAYAPELADVPRAGIVHRLDAGTSGLMVVARTLAAQADLVRQLQARTVRREYWALVLGEPRRHGTVDAPIGRDPRNPLRFKVSHASNARSARTQYWNLASVRHGNATLSWLACRLDTGRTHQIRVHLEHLGHPLLGDPVYRRRLPSPDATVAWRSFGRQALHACRLGLEHPRTRVPMQWFRAPPADLAELMQSLGFGPTDRPATLPGDA